MDINLKNEIEPAILRVPSVVVTDCELGIETKIDADWEYNRRQYELWEIYNHWPSGFLLHVAGPIDDGVMVQAIWQNYSIQSAYMAEIGVHRFTEVVRVMTKEGGGDQTPLADVEPVHRSITHLSFGPLAAQFIDIGADLDESAGVKLGSVLTAFDVQIESLDEPSTLALWSDLNLVEQIDPQLIMRLQDADPETEGEGAATSLRETQVWSSKGAAERFVHEQLYPQLAQTGASRAQLPEIKFREIRRLAISSGELNPQRFADHRLT